MRTTVEITLEQHRALSTLASRRGIRGFSPLVQEALDLYLSQRGAADIEAVLSLEGTISAEEGDEIERRIHDAWTTWQTGT